MVVISYLYLIKKIEIEYRFHIFKCMDHKPKPNYYNVYFLHEDVNFIYIFISQTNMKISLSRV